MYRWYHSSTASSNRQKRIDAIKNIRYYYSHVVNGVSVICLLIVTLLIIIEYGSRRSLASTGYCLLSAQTTMAVCQYCRLYSVDIL